MSNTNAAADRDANAALSPSPTATLHATRRVRRASGSPLHESVRSLPSPLPLSPNDWTLTPANLVTLLFFYPIPSGAGAGAGADADAAAARFLDAARLESSLQRLLAFYPILDGRFVYDERGRMQVEWKDEDEDEASEKPEGEQAQAGPGGVRFSTASANCSLQHLPLDTARYSGPQCLPLSLQLTPPFDFARALSQPLLHLQHTRFACGGVSLALQLSHVVADMQGAVQLMQDLALLYHANSAEAELRALPTLDRSWLLPSEAEMESRLQSHAERRTYYLGQSRYEFQPGCVARCFRFSATQLARIKNAATPTPSAAAASADADADADADTRDSDSGSGCLAPWVSTFESLTALLHRLFYRVRHGADESAALQWAHDAEVRGDEAKLIMATNWRTRLRQPECAQRFFANCNFTTGVWLRPTELLSLSLPALASRIHASIAQHDSDAVKGHIAWLHAQSDARQIQLNMDLRHGAVITAWNKLGLYAVRFEGVAASRILLPQWDGLQGYIVVMEAPQEANSGGRGETNGDSSLDVTFGLEAEAMRRLEQDEEWIRFRS